jgi:hypothetical protein
MWFFFLSIVGGVFNIKAFNVSGEMCSLVSSGPLYITSSQLSYFRLRFSYFGRISGIYIIFWFIHA